MEREEHIRSLDKLIELLGKLNLSYAPAFWYAYGLYQSAKNDVLKYGLVSKNEITKYDKKIELHVKENKSRYKIVV